jgi:hypothetical protein
MQCPNPSSTATVSMVATIASHCNWGSTIRIKQGAQLASNGMVVLASNSITARAQPDPLSVRYDERHERRDGLTERRATQRVSLRYVALRSVIVPSVWPDHKLSKPSQL